MWPRMGLVPIPEKMLPVFGKAGLGPVWLPACQPEQPLGQGLHGQPLGRFLSPLGSDAIWAGLGAPPSNLVHLTLWWKCPVDQVSRQSEAELVVHAGL